MVDSQEVENRCVEIVYIDWVFDHFVADFISRAKGETGLQSGTCQPIGESMVIVVSARAEPFLDFRKWSTSKFCIKNVLFQWISI